MAFEFRLKSVLKLREAAQQERQQELAQIIQVENLLKDQHEQLVQQLEEIEAELRSAQQQAINVDSLIALRRNINDARGAIRQVEAQQGEIAQELERRQVKLALANQEVQVMEKLEQKQREEHQQRLQAQEQMQLDEFRRRGPQA